MQEENVSNYFIVVDGVSTGPFSLDELRRHPNLNPEALVWKPGLDSWQAAQTFPELSQVFTYQQDVDVQTPPDFHQPPIGQTQDPFDGNYKHNPNESQPPYGTRDNNFANNPQYQSNHTYNNHNNSHNNNYYNRPNPPHYQHPHPGYDNRYSGYRPNIHTNWLPWAVVATVFGFFTSCVGAIFGIIGIVQANKANTFYSQNMDVEGDAANSTAKIMTIIGLVLAGIGLIALFSFGNLFSYFY